MNVGESLPTHPQLHIFLAALGSLNTWEEHHLTCYHVSEAQS